jgi:hypothetical protein
MCVNFNQNLYFPTESHIKSCRAGCAVARVPNYLKPIVKRAPARAGHPESIWNASVSREEDIIQVNMPNAGFVVVLESYTTNANVVQSKPQTIRPISILGVEHFIVISALCKLSLHAGMHTVNHVLWF